MVSVIIPTFNRLRFTARAVQSVLKQTFKDIEVVVVDDGSKEPVTEADLGHDPRVRVIRHEVNRGVGATRNTGVKAAKGEVLAFLDSDDFWVPEKLASQMALYDKQPDKNNILVYSTYFYEKGGKWVPEPLWPISKNEAVSDYLFVNLGDIHTSTWLGSRELFEKHPFCEDLLRHQDWDLLLECDEAHVRFVHCATPGGIRTADLRKDRLSTAAVMRMRRFFLDRNKGRMSNQAAVLLEGAYRSLARPEAPFWRKQLYQIGYFLSSARLTFLQKVGLVFSYTKARLLFKIQSKLRQRTPRDLGFEANPPA